MARAATSRTALMREAQAAIRAARDEHKRALVAHARFRRQIPALLAARRRGLTLELKRHRTNVAHSVTSRREAIAQARRQLQEYQEQQRADLKRHALEVSAALRAYRSQLARLEAIRAGRLEDAAKHLRRARDARPVASRAAVAAKRAARERNAELWDEVRANLEGNPVALAAIATEATRRRWLAAAGPMKGLSKSAKAHKLYELITEGTEDDPEAVRLLAEQGDRAGEELARLAAAEQADLEDHEEATRRRAKVRSRRQTVPF